MELQDRRAGEGAARGRVMMGIAVNLMRSVFRGAGYGDDQADEASALIVLLAYLTAIWFVIEVSS